MVAAGVLAGGVIAGGVVLAPKSKPENSRPLPQVSVVAKTPVQETPKPVEVVAKVADEAPVVKAPPPKASPPTRRGPPTPESVAQVPPPSSVDAELAALDDAVAAARAGRPREALNVVEAHIAAFPQSLLAQEREVVAIEALVALGRVDDARDRLRAFRRRWPTSTHLVRLETLLPE
jgi:TolA-binding protein